MIKALSKPMSSPGRAASDKFPPPLLRFLRTNAGSRSSRGRSRSSPMFSYLRTRKTSNAVLETTQEPSSPKVTCIGQVRVRRNKKSATGKGKRKRLSCWKRFQAKKKKETKKNKKRRLIPLIRFRSCFGKWGLFFRFGYCKKVDDVAEDSACSDQIDTSASKKVDKGRGNGNFCNGSNINSNTNTTRSCSFGSVEEDECRRRASVDSCSVSSPPKNALLLTRCRSAPYRSSSLRGRFWVEDESEKEGEKSVENDDVGAVVVEEEEEEKGRVSEESSTSKEVLEEREDLKGIAVRVHDQQKQHPLLLTRCKSEPATTGERLMGGIAEGGHNGKISFWRQRRLGNAVVEPCSSHPNS